MKAVIAVAVICGLATSARAAEAPDSWIALSSRPELRFAPSDGGRSFTTDSDWPGFSRHEGGWRGSNDFDEDRWKPTFGGHERGEGDGDGLGEHEDPSPAPEPSTLGLLAFGAVLLGYFRMKGARPK